MPPKTTTTPSSTAPGDPFSSPDPRGRPYSRNEARFYLPAQFDPVNYDEISDIEATSWRFALDPKELGGFTRVTVKRLNAGEQGLEVTLSTSPSSTVREIVVDTVFDPFHYLFNRLIFEDGSIAKVVYSGESYIGGGDKHDFLYGGAGSEVLNGKGSSDYMNGGSGNDTYIVDNAGDFIGESVETGIETVKASVTWSLRQNTQQGNESLPTPEMVATGIDNLILTGRGDIDGTGNYLNNNITGNNGNNVLVGFGDDDEIVRISDSKARERAQNRYRHQVDTLTGNRGNDTFVLGDTSNVFYTLSGDSDYAVIKDFSPGNDTIRVNGSAIDYSLEIRGSNAWIFTQGSNDLIAIVNGVTNLGAITDSFVSAT